MKLHLLLYKLENKIRRFAIERLMQIISVVMAIVLIADVLIMMKTNGAAISIKYYLAFDRAAILNGQVWRVISFIFAYPSASRIPFILLSLYFFFWTGSAVEEYWGKARFNLYYLFGILGTVAAGFIVGYVDNIFLNLSIFLAFSTMFPERQVLLFFFIPVKVKWIGIVEGALLAMMFITGSWATRAAIIAAVLNYLLFFGYDLFSRIKRAYEDYKWRKNGYR